MMKSMLTNANFERVIQKIIVVNDSIDELFFESIFFEDDVFSRDEHRVVIVDVQTKKTRKNVVDEKIVDVRHASNFVNFDHIDETNVVFFDVNVSNLRSDELKSELIFLLIDETNVVEKTRIENKNRKTKIETKKNNETNEKQNQIEKSRKMRKTRKKKSQKAIVREIHEIVAIQKSIKSIKFQILNDLRITKKKNQNRQRLTFGTRNDKSNNKRKILKHKRASSSKRKILKHKRTNNKRRKIFKHKRANDKRREIFKHKRTSDNEREIFKHKRTSDSKRKIFKHKRTSNKRREIFKHRRANDKRQKIFKHRRANDIKKRKNTNEKSIEIDA